jgi:hypothetical protein
MTHADTRADFGNIHRLPQLELMPDPGAIMLRIVHLPRENHYGILLANVPSGFHETAVEFVQPNDDNCRWVLVFEADVEVD